MITALNITDLYMIDFMYGINRVDNMNYCSYYQYTLDKNVVLQGVLLHDPAPKSLDENGYLIA